MGVLIMNDENVLRKWKSCRVGNLFAASISVGHHMLKNWGQGSTDFSSQRPQRESTATSVCGTRLSGQGRQREGDPSA